MRKFVVGDIHGAHKALLQVFERSGFDYENDQLVCLGDVVDGWPDSKACLDELMKVKNLVYIMGNHDEWFFDFARGGWADSLWTTQGGKATLVSFFPDLANETEHNICLFARHKVVDEKYVKFFENALMYYVTEDDDVFVHGGFWRLHRVDEQACEFTWNRDLLKYAIVEETKKRSEKVTLHKRVFLGHTALNSNKPMKFCEVWAMDTGAGWSGYLSMMDVDTEEYWVSDKVQDLYPDETGRR